MEKLQLPTIKISVRNLVEFLLQSGDIDNRVATVDMDAMQMGGKLHRKIQKQMGSSYQAEVSLKETVSFDSFILQVEGRADGIITEENTTTIDEIKGTGRDIDKLKAPELIHLAQAMCYACIYGRKQGFKSTYVIGVMMTYVHLKTEEIKRFNEEFEMAYLDQWFEDLTKGYEKWAQYQISHKQERNVSIRGVEFPYLYREGQRDLVVSVYHTIKSKKQLFIQAPTGVGKTMAALYPAVKAVGEELGEKIFYLTAKTITRTVATEAMKELSKKGALAKSIVLTARDKICFLKERECNPKACSYAKGHYDRINDAVYDAIINQMAFGREEIENHAKKWMVCPFELSLDLSTWMDVIICDYNYAFDPNVQLKRVFGNGGKGEYIFLIDEAHNLVDRAREMYSATLFKDDLMKVKRSLIDVDVPLTKALSDTNKKLLGIRKQVTDYKILRQAGELYMSLTRLLVEFDRHFEEHRKEKTDSHTLEFYFQVRSFIRVYEEIDDSYLIYAQRNQETGFQVCLFCVNPAKALSEYLHKGNASIFFSATLLPMHYYKELLSTKEAYGVYIKSPFDNRNRLLLQGNDVSTKYTKRNLDMYKKYADYILEVAQSKRGNYMAFFPSYKFMDEVYQAFTQVAGDTLFYGVQSSYMSEEEREIFLENFDEKQEKSFVGFCVMGGIFSEGIDLVKDRLIGAIIVGTGLPQICLERELLKQYFDQKGYNGFDYAYAYQGMNKVLQSAGRVIRTEEDKGIIALLDDRFSEQRNKCMFPKEWRDIKICNVENIKSRLEEFWK